MSALCAQGLCVRYAAPGSPHCTRHRRRPAVERPERPNPPTLPVDGTITVVPGCPPLARSDLVCPGCGQSLATIAPGETPVPERHYLGPTTVQRGSRILHGIVGTVHANNAAPLCGIDDDMLVAMAAVRQLAWQRARREEAAV